MARRVVFRRLICDSRLVRQLHSAIRLEETSILYVDIPTLPELRALAETRADACIAIYLPTRD